MSCSGARCSSPCTHEPLSSISRAGAKVTWACSASNLFCFFKGFLAALLYLTLGFPAPSPVAFPSWSDEGPGRLCLFTFILSVFILDPKSTAVMRYHTDRAALSGVWLDTLRGSLVSKGNVRNAASPLPFCYQDGS